MLKSLAIVAAGGALGASMRFLINRLMVVYYAEHAFVATLIANVLGCLLMGLAYSWLMLKVNNNEPMVLFIMVGFLGALTTWSTFSMETVVMLQSGQVLQAVLYTLLTTVLCFAAFYLGVKL